MDLGLPNWYLSVSLCGYILRCGILAVVIRAVIFIFRAFAITRGDFLGPDPNSPRTFTWRAAWWECFHGFRHDKDHADFWIRTGIGFAELFAFPILLAAGRLPIIGAWLALKTAGSWKGWSDSRTSFDRFLMNIVLELGLVYFYLLPFVHVLERQ